MILERRHAEYSLCRIPGLVLTEQNTLLGYYECRRTNSDWADIDLKIIRSTDGGDTWETVAVIPSDGCTQNNPVMFVQGSTIHLLYHRNYKQLYYCKSTDDGKHFSVPVDISQVLETSGHFYNAVAVGPGHGIVHNGNLVVPIWFAYNTDDPKAHLPCFLRTLYSDDSGLTWQLGDVIGDGILVNPSESALAVTADNRVIISIRNQNPEKLRAFAISDNGYSNWQGLCLAPNMPDPECQGSMYHLKDTVYHINCDAQDLRKNLTIKISRDGFRTYESLLVDDRGGYADIAVSDADIYVLYETYEQTKWTGGLHFARISRKRINSVLSVPEENAE